MKCIALIVSELEHSKSDLFVVEERICNRQLHWYLKSTSAWSWPPLISTCWLLHATFLLETSVFYFRVILSKADLVTSNTFYQNLRFFKIISERSEKFFSSLVLVHYWGFFGTICAHTFCKFSFQLTFMFRASN
jgi:hypothetical protein